MLKYNKLKKSYFRQSFAFYISHARHLISRVNRKCQTGSNKPLLRCQKCEIDRSHCPKSELLKSIVCTAQQK